MMSFNDALGTTLAASRGDRTEQVALTTFCDTIAGGVQTLDGASSRSPFPIPRSPSFFTGKPEIPGLGRAFLMRNYRADLGKWQTADPLGYPDGWNQLAYCGNAVSICVDKFGMWATGTSYSITDKEVPLTVSSTRTQENDLWWADKSDNYFAGSGEPLSQALVEYAQGQTGATASDFIVDQKCFPQIEADSGFALVRAYVANKMRGVPYNTIVAFDENIDIVPTTLTSKDLNHSIHGVIFHLSGSITASRHWKGKLTVSFSDPYDFKATDPDWKVRVWGRLYDNGWISRFSTTGTWNVAFEE